MALLDTLLGGLPGLIGKVIDRVVPDPVERERIKLELVKTENRQVLEELHESMAAIVAEARSEDPWTSRARPTFLYIMYLVILLCVLGGVIGIFAPTSVQMAAANIKDLLQAIPESLWWLFGSGYLGYTASRSFDKWKTTTR